MTNGATRYTTSILVATITIMLLAASMIGTNNVFAGKTEYNQASSQTEACGNGEFPFNVLCQNLESEVQGDGNAINIIGLQTGGEALDQIREPPEDRSCEECFERFLTEEEIRELVQLFVIQQSDGSVTPFTTLEQVCKFLELIADVGVSFEGDLRSILQNMGVDPTIIESLIECLTGIGVIVIFPG